jgi:hypothetical protein
MRQLRKVQIAVSLHSRRVTAPSSPESAAVLSRVPFDQQGTHEYTLHNALVCQKNQQRIGDQ